MIENFSCVEQINLKYEIGWFLGFQYNIFTSKERKELPLLHYCILFQINRYYNFYSKNFALFCCFQLEKNTHQN